MNILPEKSIFSPVKEKIVKKIPPIFTLRSGKLSKIALFLEKIVKISIFLGGKLQKFANLGVKNEKNAFFRVKSIKNCTFWG